MNKFTLPARVVKAANLFVAKNDPRYYLCGFLVSSTDVMATDGHTLILCKLNDEIENHSPVIIKTVGSIPAKCYEVEFIKSDGKQSGTGFCNNVDGQTVGVIFFEIIDGNFPERARKYATEQEVNPISKIGVNCKYLDRAYKAAMLIGTHGKYGYPHAALTFNGENNAIHLDVNGPEHSAVVVIMPTRL